MDSGPSIGKEEIFTNLLVQQLNDYNNLYQIDKCYNILKEESIDKETRTLKLYLRLGADIVCDAWYNAIFRKFEIERAYKTLNKEIIYKLMNNKVN